jgi:hypothetical protein
MEKVRVSPPYLDFSRHAADNRFFLTDRLANPPANPSSRALCSTEQQAKLG